MYTKSSHHDIYSLVGLCLILTVTGWVTDDLLSKIHDNPILSEVFSDPTLSQALAQFQSNPQAVMAAAKDDPKVSLMGTSHKGVVSHLYGDSLSHD